MPRTKEAEAAYREKNRELLRQRGRELYQRHRERFLSKVKERSKGNTEQKSAYDKRRRESLRVELAEKDKIKARRRYLKEPKKMMIERARKRAKMSGIPFMISENDFHIPTHCPILGIELEFASGSGGRPNSPSLDRINNSLGYIPGNVSVISRHANLIKGAIDLAQAEKLVSYLRSSSPII